MRIAGIGARTLGEEIATEPQPVKAVLFDFSNTLFHVLDDADWIRAVAAERGTPFDEETITRLVGELEAAWALPHVVEAQQGRDLSPERHRTAGTTWLNAVGELAPLTEELYAFLTTPPCWVPYDDVAPVLTELRRRGLPVGVVSDIAWDIRETFAYYGLAGLVDAFALSYELGAAKPDPAVFGHACEQLGAEPDQVLMVGDTPASDGGAAALGMRAYVLPATGAMARRRGLDAVIDLVGGR